MLDKTRSTIPGTKVEMLRSFSALKKAHASIGRTLMSFANAAQTMQQKTIAIHEYTQRNLSEVLGTSRSCTLENGGTIAYRTIPGRMSCGDDERQKFFERLKALGLSDCINYNPSLDESALQEVFEKDPTMQSKLQQEFPTFKVGESYGQLTLTFPGVEWKIQGNSAKGDYRPIPPERKKKAA